MHPPASSAGAPPSRLKLLLRVYSAEELAHSSSQGAYCKMYLGDSPMLDGSGGSGRRLSESGASSSATSPPPPDDLLQLAHRDSAGLDDGEVDGVRVFRTKVAHQQPNRLAPPETIWDETFEVPMPARGDGEEAILSVRVKSRHLLYSPVIGACAISLLSLRVGERLEQWFPLRKGKKSAGRLRLTLLLAADDGKRRPRSAQRVGEHHNGVHLPQQQGQGANNQGKGPSPDVLAARAANLEADDAIRRLLERRLREDEERRQRKLTRRASRREDKHKRAAEAHDRGPSRPGDGPLAHVGPPVVEMRANKWEDASALIARKLDDVAVHGGAKRPPQPQPQPPVPPFGTAASSEYERRLDRKLRRLRRERRRLEALKQQLKKYVPDLRLGDSGSGSGSGSDSTLSSASDGHEGREGRARAAERPRRSTP